MMDFLFGWSYNHLLSNKINKENIIIYRVITSKEKAVIITGVRLELEFIQEVFLMKWSGFFL
jgi:hypothetical protein